MANEALFDYFDKINNESNKNEKTNKAELQNNVTEEHRKIEQQNSQENNQKVNKKLEKLPNKNNSDNKKVEEKDSPNIVFKVNIKKVPLTKDDKNDKKEIPSTEKLSEKSEQNITENDIKKIPANKTSKRKAPADIDAFLAKARALNAELQEREQKEQIKEIVEEKKEYPPKKEEKELSNDPAEVSIQELLARAETHFVDDWIETYEKAKRSRKDNEVAKKLKAGRFRYNKDRQIELLPDMRTDNMSAEELLDTKWKIN